MLQEENNTRATLGEHAVRRDAAAPGARVHGACVGVYVQYVRCRASNYQTSKPAVEIPSRDPQLPGAGGAAKLKPSKGSVFFEHTDFSERLPKDQHGTLTDRVTCIHDRDAMLKL